MADGEIRRAMQVVFRAIEVVREAYQGVGGMGAAGASGGAGAEEGGKRVNGVRRAAGFSGGAVAAEVELLERAGRRLWEVQGNLLSDSVERRVREIRKGAAELRQIAKALGVQARRGRGGSRDRIGGVHVAELVEALDDAGETVEAVCEMVEIGVRAGLVG